MSRIEARVSRAAVNALQNQLDLAIGLLQNAQKCREAVAREEEVIQAAREAYRHSMQALGKLPQFPKADMERVQRSVEEFHSAMSLLSRTTHA